MKNLLILFYLLLIGCGSSKESITEENPCEVDFQYDDFYILDKQQVVYFSGNLLNDCKKSVAEATGSFSFELIVETKANNGEIKSIFTDNTDISQVFDFSPQDNILFLKNPAKFNQGNFSYKTTIDYDFFKTLQQAEINHGIFSQEQFDELLTQKELWNNWNFPWAGEVSKFTVQLSYPLIEEVTLPTKISLKFYSK